VGIFRGALKELSNENSWIDWISKYQDQILDWNKFSKEELQESINQFVEKVYVRFDKEKKEHIITIRFKIPLVDDKIDYNDQDNKKKSYKVKEGKTDLKGNISIKSPWNTKKLVDNLAHLSPYSTVTDCS